MTDTDLFLLALATGAASWLLRAIPLALLRRPLRSPRLVAFIRTLPYAILAAMIVPDGFSATAAPALPAAVSATGASAGLAAALALALLGRSLPTVALGGVLTAWALQTLLA